MSLTKQVLPIMDSRALDVSIFDDVKIWNHKISDEKFSCEDQKCFPGAWYRKIVSSEDKWLGIEGVIQLGEFKPDPKRFNLDGLKRYMDNPSVYMGGKALLESDAGLSLNLTYLDSDTYKSLNLSAPKLCWRPFWRYIYKQAEDINGNVLRNEVNSWNISEPQSLIYYYFPGDIIRMKIYSPIPDYLQLRIELVKETDIPKYVELRKKYNLKDNKPSDFYSPIFHSEGHGKMDAEFKRVNAIDQYGNEGLSAKDTEAFVSKATWYETFLYRKIDGTIYKVPFNKNRQTSLICPSKEAVNVLSINDDLGAESIEIHPGNIYK